MKLFKRLLMASILTSLSILAEDKVMQQSASYFQTGNYKGVVALVTAEIDKGSQEKTYYLLRAIANHNQGKTKNITERIFLDQKSLVDINQYFGLGGSEAAAFFYRALAKQSSYELSFIAKMKKKLENEIISDFNKAIELSPTLEVYEERLKFYTLIGNRKMAQLDRHKVMQFKPKIAATPISIEKDYLSSNGRKLGVITTRSGLQYKKLNAGTGRSPRKHDLVTVHYRGKFIDGTIFDSSIDRGRPITIRLTQVIKGWKEALLLMRVGDRFEITVPSKLAYGSRGTSAVKPHSVLVFEMQLLGIDGK